MAAKMKKALLWLLAVGTTLAVIVSCGGPGGGGGNIPTASATTKSVSLTGAQEVPAVTTAAVGNGFISVEESTGAVSGTITTFGINGTVAHIHEGPVGVVSPVIVPLEQVQPGVWQVPDGSVLTPSQVTSFKNGNLYVNVHSAANPNGEIRAQIGRMIFFATLTGNQENPPTGSSATGTGRWIFNPDTNVITGEENVAGMSATVSHFHIGPIGTNAGVAIPFAGGPTTWTLAPTTLTADQVTQLLAGNFYANAHSATFPSGEIRGQVNLPMRCTTLTGTQETPPNSSAATGTGCVMVNPFDKTVAGRIETQGIEGTLAHIHQGPQGVVSPVIVPMTQTSPGVWTTAANAKLTDDQYVNWLKGLHYLNVHSAALPVGEIRGQLLVGQ
jgi:CHRD domain-containing protein